MPGLRKAFCEATAARRTARSGRASTPRIADHPPRGVGVIRVIEDQITALRPYNARYTGDHRSIFRERFVEMITRVSRCSVVDGRLYLKDCSQYVTWANEQVPHQLPRWLTRKSATSDSALISLSRLVNPWPSFSYTSYRTSTPLARNFSTIWSDSAFGTRGSRAP